MGCFYIACSLVKSPVLRVCSRCNEVEICDVTNGVCMFILLIILSGIFFHFSLFSYSDSNVDIFIDCIAKQTCLIHNRVFRLNVSRFVAKKTGVTKTQFVLLGICDVYFTC